jgi:Zn-finger nucleic acid-binding protein
MKPYLQCPVCKPKVMSWVELETDLRAQQCATCGGVWLEANDYWRWVQHQPPRATVRTPYQNGFSSTDIERAKICPEDGHLMTRYRVAHGVDSTLDRCATCHGVWFDPHEWEVVCDHHLHQDIHTIFTNGWQRNIRNEAQRAHFEQLYVEKLGAADFAEIQRIRAWLNQHPHQGMLMAFLMNPDPYRLREIQVTLIET